MRKLAEGARWRIVVDLRKDFDPDEVSEAEARLLFDEAVGLMVA